MQIALPVLSAAGLCCALLPTALLSAHTGGFGQVHRRDLGEDMAGILSHWRRLGLRFDAVYTGYLGAAAQAQLLLEALDTLMAPGARLFVDPVMADHGRPYSFCGEEMLDGFRALCARADVIFPNRTEAALLLGLPATPGEEPGMPERDAVLSLGAPQAVVSGAASGEEQIGVRVFSAGEEPRTLLRRRFPGAYPGTGDLLAASAIAGLMQGMPLAGACGLALDLMENALTEARAAPRPARFGLPFERALPGFIRALGL